MNYSGRSGGFTGGSSGASTGPADISQIYERNQEATVYVGNLDIKTDEDLLWEIFTQAGPVKNVHMPRDKVTGVHSSDYLILKFLILLILGF